MGRAELLLVWMGARSSTSKRRTSGTLACFVLARALGQPTRLPGGTGRRENGQRASSITDSM
jgi:hypothetical protein